METQQQPPEAAPVETPAAEPDKNNESEEKTGDKQQEPESQDDAKGKKEKDKVAAIAYKRREADRRAREAESKLVEQQAETERLRKRLEALETGSPSSTGKQADGQPAATSTGGFDKPKPSVKDYTEAGGKFFKEGDDYEDARTRYEDARDEWRDAKRQFDDKQAAETRSAGEIRKAFVKDMESAMEAHPDFEDARDYVLANAPEGLQVAISNMPRFSKEKASWPELVVYLEQNREELDSIKEIYAENQFAAIAELGRIVHSLKPAAPSKAATAPTTPAQPKPPKAAPTPPAVVGGNAAPVPVDLETADMDTFAREVSKYLGKS